MNEMPQNESEEMSPYEYELDGYLKELIETSIYYKHLIDTAKTNLKKDFYKKKLKKNNQKLFDLIMLDDSLRGG